MEQWQERVVMERDDLYGKTDRLNAFLSGDGAKQLLPDQAMLMMKQLKTMQEYLHILNQRIYLFDK